MHALFSNDIVHTFRIALHSSITNAIIAAENDPLEFYYVCNRYKRRRRRRRKKCRKKIDSIDGRRVVCRARAHAAQPLCASIS